MSLRSQNSEKSWRLAITAGSAVCPLGLGTASILQKMMNQQGPLGNYQGGFLRLNSESDQAMAVGLGAREKKLDRVHRMAILTAQKIRGNLGRSDYFGVVVGSSRGATTAFEAFHADFLANRRLSPLASPVTTSGMLGASVARHLGCKGIVQTVSTTCSTGLNALMIGAMMILSQQTPTVFIGAAEAANTEFSWEMLRAAKVLADLSQQRYPVRPFGVNRSGTIPSEGSFGLVLTRESNDPLGYLLGIGNGMETGSLTGVSENGDALVIALTQALAKSGLDPDDIDLIVPHGAGTLKGDAAELQAYHEVFGDQIPTLVPHKWALGHALGASSGISLLLALEHLHSGLVPDLPYELVEQVQFKPLLQPKNAIVVSLGFGGYATAAVVSKC